MVAGFKVCQNTNNNLLNAYDSYNKATEDLLDSLDNEYNWVDAYESSGILCIKSQAGQYSMELRRVWKHTFLSFCTW